MIEDYIAEEDQIEIVKETIEGHKLSTFNTEGILLEIFVTYGVVLSEALVEDVLEAMVAHGKLFVDKNGDYVASEAAAEVPSATI